MPALSPRESASAKKAALSRARAGRPKETLETPRDVRSPRRESSESASSVASAPPPVETDMARGSKMSRSGPMPYFAASASIFSATATRPAALSGMPSSSSVRAMSAAPYFCATGNTASMEARLPLTELISGRPL